MTFLQPHLIESHVRTKYTENAKRRAPFNDAGKLAASES